MVSPYSRALGEVLRELRRTRGLTQQDLDFDTGIHRTTISFWERGVHSPTVENLRTLSKKLGVTPAEILRMAEERYAADKKAKRKPRKIPKGRPRNPR